MAQEIAIDDHVLNRMIKSGGMAPPFRMNEVTVRATNKAAKTEISLCFTKDSTFPISGCPRCLHADVLDVPGLSGRPGLKSVGSIRWASRTGKRQRRFDWTPPTLPSPKEKEDIITRYSDARHLLGSVTNLMSTASVLRRRTSAAARLSSVGASDQYWCGTCFADHSRRSLDRANLRATDERG